MRADESVLVDAMNSLARARAENLIGPYRQLDGVEGDQSVVFDIEPLRDLSNEDRDRFAAILRGFGLELGPAPP